MGNDYITDYSNSVSIDYGQVDSSISSTREIMVPCGYYLKTASSSSDYMGLSNAGLDNGFISEFDQNINNLRSSLIATFGGLDEIVKHTRLVDENIASNMPNLPSETEEETETSSDIVVSADTNVTMEKLDKQNSIETEEATAENPGEYFKRKYLEEQKIGNGDVDDEEINSVIDKYGIKDQTKDKTEEVKTNEPGKHITKGTIKPFKIKTDMLSEANGEFVINILEGTMKLAKERNISLFNLLSNTDYANDIKEIITSNPLNIGLASIDGQIMQQDLLQTFKCLSVGELINIGYSEDVAKEIMNFINTNYVIS